MNEIPVTILKQWDEISVTEKHILVNRRFNLIVSRFMNNMENLWFEETIKVLESEYNLDSIVGDDIHTKQDGTYRTLLQNLYKNSWLYK